MTSAELLTLINNTVVANGANEITADVLRPVLVAMVNQINTLVGDESDLPIGSDTVIEAINNTTTTGVAVLTGTADPNVTPPSSYNIGDFYSQTVSSIIIAFWQYNGIKWVEVLSRAEQKIRDYELVTTSVVLDENNDVIVYNGTPFMGDSITFPDASLNEGKIFTIINISIDFVATSIYIDLTNNSTFGLLANSVLKIISDGTVWRQINNNDVSTGS